MKNNSLKYKIGQIVYNAINEAFDFNAEEIDTGNDYDAAKDAYLFSIRNKVNKILKDVYGISKFKKYKHAYSDNKIGTVYVLDDRNSGESALTDKMINLLINQNFSTYYFSLISLYPYEKIKEENNTTYSKKELLNNLEAVIKNVYKINDIKRIISYKIYVSPDKKLLIYDNIKLHNIRELVEIIPSFIIIRNEEITYKSTNDDFLKSIYSFSNIIEAEKLKLYAAVADYNYDNDNNPLSTYQKTYTAADNTLFKVLHVYPWCGKEKTILVDKNPLHFKRNLRLFLGGGGCQTYEPVKNEITEKTFIQESVFSLGLVKFIITDDKDYIKNTLGKDVLNIKPYYLNVNNVKLKHTTSLDEIYAFIVLTAKGKLVGERIKDKKAISPKAIRELAMNL